MARIGKMIVSVDGGTNTQRITVSTTGRKGSVALNTTSRTLDQSFATGAANSDAFWLAILELVVAAL